MKNFFISYNQEDRPWAEWIAWQLEEHGYSTILQAWDFRPGANFVVEMQEAVVNASRLIAILSPAYLRSLFTQSEMAAAFSRDPTGIKQILLPVRIKECELQGLWSQVIYIDLVGLDEAAATNALLNGVGQDRSKPVIPPIYPKSVHGIPSQFPGSSHPFWNVPLLRNHNFTGREKLLAELRRILLSKHSAVLTAIVGLGGIGKSQLALEYCYRHVADYEIVWWLRSEVETSLAADYANLAAELQLPESSAKDNRKIVSAVKRHLEHSHNWLLIFDNAQDVLDIQDYIPRGTAGHILITSRDPNWGGVANSLTVPVLDTADSVAYLIKRTKQDNETAARELADELGHLPLALTQAAAYIEQTGKSLTAYLELFRREQWEFLRRVNALATDQTTVATTWEICFKQLLEHDSTAVCMMNLFAFLAPDQIPLNLFRTDKAFLNEPFAGLASNPLRLDEAVARLRRYSLIDVRDEVVSIHRLVQIVARERLEKAEKLRWASTAVCLLADTFPYDSENVANWPECARLSPHALSATKHARLLGIAEEPTCRLLSGVGEYLREIAQYAEARVVHEQALEIGKRIFNSNDERLASLYNNSGLTRFATGDFKGAQFDFQRALKITQKHGNRNDLTLATRLNNLGAAHFERGHIEVALDNFQSAIELTNSVLGVDHSGVTNQLRNLAMVLWGRGDLKGARRHLEKALEIDQKKHGQNHRDVARSFRFLGSLLQTMGDLATARPFLEHSLQISEEIVGPDHPEVARGLMELGSLLWYLDEFEQSQSYLERALKIFELTYGPNHVDVARCLIELGNVLNVSGQSVEGARVCFERSLRIYEQFDGKHAFSTAASHNNLGSVLRKLGDLDGARLHLEQALSIGQSHYNRDGLSVSAYLKNYGLYLRDIGDLAGARTHLEKAIDIRKQLQMPNHPDIAKYLSYLGALLIESGDFRQARSHLRRALRIALSTLDENHSCTLYVKAELKRLQAVSKKRPSST